MFKNILKNPYNFKLKLFELTGIFEMGLKISVRFLMNLSVSTLSGRIAKNPEVLKNLKIKLENIPKILPNPKFKTFQNDLISKSLFYGFSGNTGYFQKIQQFSDNPIISNQFKNFQTFWKISNEFSGKLSAISWLFLACQASIFFWKPSS